MNMENENNTKKYEFSYWIKPDIAENNFGDIQNEIKDFIEKLGGRIVKEKNIIRENLAYPIKHYGYSFLKVNLIEFAVVKMDDFLKYLKLNANILRYTIGLTDNIDIIKIKEFKKIIVEPQEVRRVIVEKTREEKEVVDISSEASVAHQVPEKEKIILEDVDKKLEEILGREI
ncbi:MAG: 30S ribosomal protein S6 [Patescibacteria group bacterium]